MAITTWAAGDQANASDVNTNFKETILGLPAYAADSGSTDAYAVTLSPAPTAYTTGMRVFFKANTANTGVSTLNVNALGVKSIFKNVSDELSNNDIKASQIVSVVYDGTNFQLLSAPSSLNVPFWEIYVTGQGSEENLAQQISFAPDYSDFYWTRGGSASAISILRFTRDTTTGIYYFADVNVSTSNNYSTSVPGVFVTTNFVYIVGRNSALTDMRVTRFARDLTGETLFTIAGTANANLTAAACGNDSSFYVFSSGTGTTVFVYTLSGTTATRGADITISTPQGQYVRGAYFDGTDIVFYDENSGTIRRYNTSGVQQASHTRLMWQTGRTTQDERGFPIGLGPYTPGSLYVVGVYTISDETTILGFLFRGFAVKKP